MKRHALRILICLLLGVATTLAVAMSCALWSAQDCYELSAGQPEDTIPAWPDYLVDLGWPQPSRVYVYECDDSIGVTHFEMNGGDPDAGWQPNASLNKVHVSLTVRRFGIPWRAMQWELHGVTAGPRSLRIAQQADAAAGWRTGIDVSARMGVATDGYVRRIPLTPIWSGLLANTAIYAGAWWLLLIAPGVIRRRRRRRKGRCIICNYDLRGDFTDGCPECGWNRAKERA